MRRKKADQEVTGLPGPRLPLEEAWGVDTVPASDGSNQNSDSRPAASVARRTSGWIVDVMFGWFAAWAVVVSVTLALELYGVAIPGVLGGLLLLMSLLAGAKGMRWMRRIGKTRKAFAIGGGAIVIGIALMFSLSTFAGQRARGGSRESFEHRQALEEATTNFFGQEPPTGASEKYLMESVRRLGALREAFNRWSASVDPVLTATLAPTDSTQRKDLVRIQHAYEGLIGSHEDFYNELQACSDSTCRRGVRARFRSRLQAANDELNEALEGIVPGLSRRCSWETSASIWAIISAPPGVASSSSTPSGSRIR
jgi:hypothetical protein